MNDDETVYATPGNAGPVMVRNETAVSTNTPYYWSWYRNIFPSLRSSGNDEGSLPRPGSKRVVN